SNNLLYHNGAAGFIPSIIGRALGPEDEKVFALLRKRFDSLLQIKSVPHLFRAPSSGICFRKISIYAKAFVIIASFAKPLQVARFHIPATGR
ncbi:MAG: hypothetical protein ACLFUS_01680, partial [Candidatus Sumerlaeia bacterium]